MIDPRRRRFLRGAFSAVREPVVAPPRPPWAPDEAAFLERCTRCGDCTKACPRMLIAPGEGGYPEVSFAKQGCTECGECEAACKPKALDRGDARPAWRWKAVIDGRCLAVRRVECRVCAEICDVRAIRMVPEPGGVALAEVSPHQCTGCGECVSPCPTGAIRMVDPADRVAPG